MEILFKIESIKDLNSTEHTGIRWIDDTCYDMVKEFLEQNNISTGIINAILLNQNDINMDTRHCGVVVGGKLVALGAVEKYCNDCWDCGAIRVHKDYRNNGYGKKICSYITNYILSSGKVATGYTREKNVPMRRVFEYLGYKVIMTSENIGKDFYWPLMK